MEKKVIWYISHYTAPPELETHGRAIKFATYLKKYGYDVIIFCASFLHYKNIELIQGREKYIEKNYDGLKFVHIKTCRYDRNGLLRIWSMIQFSFRIHFLRKKFPKPDILIHTSQVPFENIICKTAKRMGARYIPEVLDLYPESFVAYKMISRENPILSLGYLAEKWLYRNADCLIFSMEGGRDYLIAKGWTTDSGGPIDLRKVHYLNNGVDLDDFDTNVRTFKINDPDLEDENIFRVTYIGSVRLANNLKQLIDAAAILSERKDIRFLIYGDGADRIPLENYCRENGIINVIFKQKWIELKYVPYVLSRSSLNIINHMNGEILKYGGSQGKLFQYLASGKPVCSNIRMGYDVTARYNAGVSKNLLSAQEYADAILSVLDADPEGYEEMCRNARKASLEFDYKNLCKKLAVILASCQKN